MRMFKKMFPRRAGIAAAAVAAAMVTFAPALLADGTSTIGAHGFNQFLMTDIPYPAAANNYLALGFQPGAPRYLFDHDGPISYNPTTQLLSVQSLAGYDVDSGLT